MPLQQVIDSSEVRNALELGLRTLEMVERSSLMSRKGRHCLRRFLQVFDTLGTPSPREFEFSASTTSGLDLHNLASIVPCTHTTLPASADTAIMGPISSVPLDGFYSQLITESADNFLFQSSQLSFLDTDISIANFTS